MRSVCIILTLPASSAIAEVITLPITKGYVPLTLDGQSFNVLMDTGTARSFVMYGPTYEEANGKGSCRRLPQGCYFCPDKNPCDDILERERWKVHLGGNSLYEYVEHNVTLTIGEITVKDFAFGLAIKHNGMGGSQGYMGLSFGRSALPETVLEQLKRRGIIDNLAYSIVTKGSMVNMYGVLSIGDVQLVDGQSVDMDPRYTTRRSRKPGVPVSTIKFIGEELPVISCDITKPHGVVNYASGEGSKSFIIDSGTDSIDLPSVSFGTINHMMKEAIARTARKQSKAMLSDNRIMWKDPESSFMVVRRKHVKYLPTIVYCIGGQTDCIELRVEPKHYIAHCYDAECELAIAHVRESQVLVLGVPLFRAYKIGFDLSTEQLHFSIATDRT